jgi:hypothetical protein
MTGGYAWSVRTFKEVGDAEITCVQALGVIYRLSWC